MADDLDRACAQVGRFMYHFANLENQIDAALTKLFELEGSLPKQSPAVWISIKASIWCSPMCLPKSARKKKKNA